MTQLNLSITESSPRAFYVLKKELPLKAAPETFYIPCYKARRKKKKTRLHKITALGKKVSSFSSFVPPPPLSFSQLFFLTAFSSSFEVGCCTEPDSQLSSESYPAFESLLEMSDAIDNLVLKAVYSFH